MASAQVIEVPLSQLITTDENAHDLQFLDPRPKEDLILPEDFSDSKFFVLNGAGTKGDYDISVMVQKTTEGHLLFVDRNNDENLNNDGDPILLIDEDNHADIELATKKPGGTNPLWMISKIPTPFESDPVSKSFYLGDEGQLLDRHFKVWSVINPRLSSKRGDFFFVYRLSFREGYITIEDEKYRIGLHDWDSNGVYEVDHEGVPHGDRVMLDLNRDGRLLYSNKEELFPINDFFIIGDQTYEIVEIEATGKWLRISAIDD